MELQPFTIPLNRSPCWPRLLFCRYLIPIAQEHLLASGLSCQPQSAASVAHFHRNCWSKYMSLCTPATMCWQNFQSQALGMLTQHHLIPYFSLTQYHAHPLVAHLDNSRVPNNWLPWTGLSFIRLANNRCLQGHQISNDILCWWFVGGVCIWQESSNIMWTLGWVSQSTQIQWLHWNCWLLLWIQHGYSWG